MKKKANMLDSKNGSYFLYPVYSIEKLHVRQLEPLRNENLIWKRFQDETFPPI